MTRPLTLLQKNYGAGIRAGLMLTYIQPFNGCAAEVGIGGHRCTQAPYGSIELYVDEAPPTGTWFEKLMRDLAASLPQNSWARMIFCENHLAEAAARSIEYQENFDLWSPAEYSPPVLPRPPKLLVKKELV